MIIDENFKQTELLETLLDSSLMGLESYTNRNHVKLPADYRLAHRELGLSIGLKSVEKLQVWIEQNPGLFNNKDALEFKIKNLMHYSPLSEIVDMFWLERINREAARWTAHREINMVMLATTLAPDGYLISWMPLRLRSGW